MTKSQLDILAVHALRSVEAARGRRRAQAAEQEGRTSEARLFRALAYARQIHADKTALLLQEEGESVDEALRAAASETADVKAMLRELVMTAAGEREHAIESMAIQLLKSMASHEAMTSGIQAAPAMYHVCLICGHMVGESVPERCPVCRAAREQFETIA